MSFSIAYVHRGWGDKNSEEQVKENVDFIVNAVAAVEAVCPNLQFWTFPTGGKVCRNPDRVFVLFLTFNASTVVWFRIRKSSSPCSPTQRKCSQSSSSIRRQYFLLPTDRHTHASFGGQGVEIRRHKTRRNCTIHLPLPPLSLLCNL